MMKLREIDNVDDGPSLGRIVEVSDEEGKSILDLQESRGYKAWEEAPKGAKVTGPLFPAPVDETDQQTQAETPAPPAATPAD